MSVSTMSFKEGFLTFYLPAIMVVCSFVVAGTCLSTGPFFPVGLCGLISLVFMVYGAILIARESKKAKELREAVSIEEDRVASINKRNSSDLAKKDVIINELKETVSVIQAKNAKLEDEISKIKKETTPATKPAEPVKEEAKKEEKKTTKKTTKK